MPFITAKDGAELHWREWGAGPPIVFLSSLGCDSRMWDYQIAAFADEGFRCIGFDRRGHGRSDQPARGYDFDTFADDVAALVDSLDSTDLTLIAHSMAGGEAVRYLTRQGSNRVARLILLAPTTPMLLKAHDNPNGLPMEAFEALWAQWRRELPEMGRRQPRAVLHSGDLARDDALGRDPVANLASRHPRLLPRHGGS
jgi:pimeloyl-ACP methyl ester carboxylesterase